jgi:hypothetical protein
VERTDQAGEIEPAVAGEQAFVQRRRHQVRLGLGGGVVELDRHDPGTRDGPQQRVVGSAAEPVPRVDGQTTVDAIGFADDLPGGGDVGDARPRKELEVDEEAALGGAIAQTRERGRRFVDAPPTTEHLGRVDRPRADRVGDREHLLLAVAKHLHVVDRHQRLRVERRRRPPPGRIELGNGQPMLGEARAGVGVGMALTPRRRVVAVPERDGREASGHGRGNAVDERRVARERARTEDEIAGTEGHLGMLPPFQRRFTGRRPSVRSRRSPSLADTPQGEPSPWPEARASRI